MATWNHRVVELTDNETPWFAVCEVYYDDKGIPWGHTERAVGVCGESIEEAKETLQRIKEAFDAPVLKESDFVGEKP